MYVDQFPEEDLSRERAARFDNLTIYPSIAKALCMGGDKLAVDGVLIIGEHGNYPQNEKGQTLYPRYEFFEQTVDVFRNSGRSVPVFNDKHLSWNWDWAQKMVDTAREMDFPLSAGFEPAGVVANPVGRDAAGCRSRRGDLRSPTATSTATTSMPWKTIQALAERRKGGEMRRQTAAGPARATPSGKRSRPGRWDERRLRSGAGGSLSLPQP